MERITEKQRKFILGTLHQLGLDDQRFRIMQECEGIIKIRSLNQMSGDGAQNMIEYLLKEAEEKGIKLDYYPKQNVRKRKRITSSKSIDVLVEKRRKIVIAICYQKKLFLENGKFKTQLLDEFCLSKGPFSKVFNAYDKEELQSLIDSLNTNF